MNAAVRYGVVAVVVWLGVLPLLTLMHELGHAMAALALTGQPVAVQLGRKPSIAKWRWGRVALGARFPINWVGFCAVAHPDQVTRPTQVWIALAGPLVSLLLLLVSSGAALALHSGPMLLAQLSTLFATGALIQLVVTLAPLRYPSWWGAYAGKKSDGYRALELLRQEAPA